MALTKKEINKRYYEKHKEELRAYQRHYKKTCRALINKYEYNRHVWRRAKYMANKSCPYCGTTKNLVLHHTFPKNPALRTNNYQIWGWSESRLIKELLKCLVVCNSCHTKIHKGGLNA